MWHNNFTNLFQIKVLTSVEHLFFVILDLLVVDCMLSVDHNYLKI